MWVASKVSSTTALPSGRNPGRSLAGARVVGTRCPERYPRGKVIGSPEERFQLRLFFHRRCVSGSFSICPFSSFKGKGSELVVAFPFIFLVAVFQFRIAIV
jgi:hypothetical protein